MKITVLGVRGSIPTDGADHLIYGGATACILVEADGQAIFLDAGSGILVAPDTGSEQVSILLSHTHIDHILGLPLSPIMLSDRRIDLYCEARGGMSVREQLERLMSPPLWPVGPDEYQARLVIHDLKLPMNIGAISVTGIESNHPGGSTIYRLSADGHSLVYATDYEHTAEKQRELIAFSRDTDLILYDAQYTEEEYARMKGFGHSTVEQGLTVLRESGAKSMLFVHHDPRHNDRKLAEMEQELSDSRAAFARAGMVIEI
ncbi:MAG: MBL fold metallo-hydrolase [Lachnospiraceae bacterium]|nr:MBL fold metallo-hydrolase [Lachnospiraceae bacterium]